MISSRKEAFELLEKLNAPSHLITHVTLVGEAADLLLETFDELDLPINSSLVQIGVVIHDVGKINHPHEMTGPGSDHEPEGEKILLELGVDSNIARCCMSHARFSSMDCSLEELTIALSDKLWKGKRVEELELRVIDCVADILGRDRWDIFTTLDQQFEFIAGGGHERLQRSVTS